MGNRGILSSLGAGLSLVIAGVLALLGVSAFVAFNGWPELREDRSSSAVSLAPVGASPDAERDAVVLGGGGARGESGRFTSVAGVAVAVARREADRRRAGRRTRGGRRAPANARRPGAEVGGTGPTDSGPNPAAGTNGSERASAPDVVRDVQTGAERIVHDVVDPKPDGDPPVDVPTVVDHASGTVRAVLDDAGAAVGSPKLP